MKFGVFVILFIVLSATTLCGQEVLHMVDGTTDTVKVIEINPTEIIYKKIHRLDGPRYHIDRELVKYIEFANGTTEVITTTNNTSPDDEEHSVAVQPFATKIKQNIISINIFSLPILGDANAGYERLNKAGDFGLRVNFNYHLIDNNRQEILSPKRYAVRLDFNIYPTKNKRIRYFLGPSFRIMRIIEFDVRNSSTTFGATTIEETRYNSIALLFTNGFQLVTSKSIYFGVIGGIGVGMGLSYGTENSYSRTEGMFAFNVGYAF